MKCKFEEMRSPEIGELAKKKGMVMVPIGACEEHSRHMPVITDTHIAYEASIASAEKASETIPVAVLPPVWFGYTVGTLKNWPGTITVRPKIMIDLMYDICRSLIDMGISRILIVNGHGNNPGMLDVAVRSVADDFKVFPGIVNTYGCWDAEAVNRHRRSKEGGISHAGEAETALMLYLSSLVDMSEAVDTDMMTSNLASCPVDACSGRKKSLFLSTWFLENSVHGGCGDPTPATKEFGELIFSMIVDKMTAIITEFYDVQEKMSERKLKRKCTTF